MAAARSAGALTSRSQVVAALRPTQDREKERGTEDRRDHANGDLPEQASHKVGHDHQDRAADRRERQDGTGVRADEDSDDVRDDEADEPDQAADRDGCRRDERRESEEDGSLATDVDTEV